MRKLILVAIFLSGCSTFWQAPSRKDTKNLSSSVSIESKQDQIIQRADNIKETANSPDLATKGPELKQNASAIKDLAKSTKKDSIKIQNRSDGKFHMPSWLLWTLIIGGLAYLGLLPVIAGVGIRIIHKVAKGIKQVEY